ncbi:MAG: hypothetical protein H8D97_00330 [Proteobacteria bacterium]|nr:hypothetical protein [Pseudomonadota bacterium]
MNLIKRTIDYDKCNILNFREYQYGLIMEIIRLCFKYMETHGFVYNKSKYSEDVIDDIAYSSRHHFATKIVEIKINQRDTPFMKIAIPKLIEGQFFRLNGSLYIPQFYIIDKPITIKKNSISLYALFNSLTIYNSDGRIIFLGENIPISRFLRLYYEDDKDLKDVLDFLQVENQMNEDMNTCLKNLSNTFGVPPIKEEIQKKIDSLFFDDWTLELYEECYGIKNATMTDIFNLIFKNKTIENNTFIDINYKRLVFIEYLLAPLLKITAANVNKMVLENKVPQLMGTKLGNIISYFFNDLKKANRYDTVNGFSGIINLKANFRSPNAGKELPKEVSNVHTSFKHKICPITVSNTNPGESITLVPEQNLKSLKFGIFDV